MKAIRKGLGTPRDIAAFSMLPLNSSWGELQDPASMEGRSMARQSKDNDCLGLKACKWPQGCFVFFAVSHPGAMRGWLSLGVDPKKNNKKKTVE